jgi:hypothetical protein
MAIRDLSVDVDVHRPGVDELPSAEEAGVAPDLDPSVGAACRACTAGSDDLRLDAACRNEEVGASVRCRHLIVRRRDPSDRETDDTRRCPSGRDRPGPYCVADRRRGTSLYEPGRSLRRACGTSRTRRAGSTGRTCTTSRTHRAGRTSPFSLADMAARKYGPAHPGQSVETPAESRRSGITPR